MARGRFGTYADRIRAGLHGAFAEAHTPREVAASFALGAFITMLPTLGTGLILFVVIVAVSERVSKLALFASVLVFNPLVKWGVYATSFALGVLLLGPVEGTSITAVSLADGPDIVTRLLVGNLLLAVLATVGSYVVVYRLAVRYEAEEIAEKIDEVLAEIVED